MQRCHDAGKCVRCRQTNDRPERWLCTACARLVTEERRAGRPASTKLCGRCEKPGHNRRTCTEPEPVIVDEQSG